ncbi:glycosyltransferase family 2 protein [Thermosynechococcus sp.]|uniref:glycosyltransferase family 2 protein n=1 Tax=Thermosynechococcus sp. TaxID=2814275 RepID=UPI00391CBB19
MKPAISVIMPVRNQAKYVEAAIKSILEQTFHDFELLVIDDGSTDGSADLIAHQVKANSKVTFLSREKRGLVQTLNELLVWAKGDYVACMHGDDIAHPERLEKQFKWIHQHQLDICGTFVTLFGWQRGLWRYPLSHTGCEVELLFGVPFAHPSVVARKDMLTSLKYSAQYECEDYDLWQRVWAAGGRMGNVPEPLLRYRTHPKQRSQVYRTIVAYQASSIRHRHWQALLQRQLGWSAEQARASMAQPWTVWSVFQQLEKTYEHPEAKTRLGATGFFRWYAHEVKFPLAQSAKSVAKGG